MDGDGGEEIGLENQTGEMMLGLEKSDGEEVVWFWKFQNCFRVIICDLVC